MSNGGRGDLRAIANGLFPVGGDTAQLPPEGRQEVREAVDALLRIFSHQEARLALALEQLDRAADEIERLRGSVATTKASTPALPPGDETR